MKNLWTIVACVAAASAAGIITEWSVTKDTMQTVMQSVQTCVPQIKSMPFELRGYYLRLKPEQEI